MRPALTTQGLAELAAPFARAALLGLAELHAVDLLAEAAAERAPEVLLGLAFALAAPRRGHVGVDLSRARQSALDEAAWAGHAAEARVAALPWPADGEAWMARVSRSPLVGAGAPFALHRGLLLTRRWLRAQERLVAALAARAALPPCPIGAAMRARLESLTPPGPAADEQRAALELALGRPLTVLTGGPGTGKTTVVRRLLLALRAGGGAARVALAAPTGKAAVRLERSLTEGPAEALAAGEGAWLSSLEAVTLHRLLRSDPRRPGRFRHGPDLPLAADVVIVDEVSMVDLALMAALLEAVGPSARLVLLGDPDQLASVSAGCVLADILAGAPHGSALGACVARLSFAHRFEATSGLGRLAGVVAAGQSRELDSLVAEIAAGGLPGVRLIPPTAADALPAAALELARDGFGPHLEALARGPRPGEGEEAWLRRALELHERFRVLGVHRAGPLGIEGLNAAIEGALGAPRYGQPLMVRANSYALGRMNGDLGLLVPGPHGPRAAFPAAVAGGVELLEASRLPPHEPAYALTVHKSQGSQFDEVLVVLPRHGSRLLTRELLYTAATRARKRLALVAEPAELRSALGRRVERASTLAEDLAQLTPPA